MTHLFIKKAQTDSPFLLLHGTGGDERSLVDIANFLNPKASILSVRGAVSEGGLNRYFKRFGEGQFDLEDLEIKSDDLLSRVCLLAEKYDLATENLIVIGYSNGANIGTHMILEREDSFKTAILFHSMSLGKHTKKFLLKDTDLWLSYGVNDPLVSQKEFERLTEVIETRGGKISIFETKSGHGLLREELEDAKNWLENRKNE